MQQLYTAIFVLDTYVVNKLFVATSHLEAQRMVDINPDIRKGVEGYRLHIVEHVMSVQDLREGKVGTV